MCKQRAVYPARKRPLTAPPPVFSSTRAWRASEASRCSERRRRCALAEEWVLCADGQQRRPGRRARVHQPFLDGIAMCLRDMCTCVGTRRATRGRPEGRGRSQGAAADTRALREEEQVRECAQIELGPRWRQPALGDAARTQVSLRALGRRALGAGGWLRRRRARRRRRVLLAGAAGHGFVRRVWSA